MSWRLRLAVAPIALLALVGGCADDDAGAVPVTSVLGEAEAIELADGMLTAFQAGDFATFSAQWSPAMRDAIAESDWRAFRDDTLAVAGEYLGIAAAELTAADTAGMVRWEFVADFSEVDHTLAIVMRPTDTVIEGSFITPVG